MRVCKVFQGDPLTHPIILSQLQSEFIKQYHVEVIGWEMIDRPEGGFSLSSKLPRVPVFRPFRYFEFLIQCLKLFRENRYDLIHAHDLPALLPAVLYKQFTNPRVKVVYDAHELYPFMNHPPSKLWDKILAFCLKRVDETIVSNRSRRDFLSKRYRIPKTPKVLYNITPMPVCNENIVTNRIRDMYQIQDDTKIVLYHGSLSFSRKVDFVVENFRHIEGGFLLLLGKTNSKILEYINATIERHGLQGKVAYGGEFSRDQALEYVQAADIGLVIYDDKTINNLYCAPMKFYEYLYFKLPMVMCNNPGLIELLEESEVGMSFDVNRADSFVASLQTMITDTSKYAVCKQNLEQARETLNISHNEQVIRDMYEQLLDRNEVSS